MHVPGLFPRMPFDFVFQKLLFVFTCPGLKLKYENKFFS